MGINHMLSPKKAKYFFVILLILALSFSLLSCKKSDQEKVKVRTGTRVVCEYGELLEDNTRLVTVPKAKAEKYKIRTVRKLCLKHRRAENLYKQAEKALSNGDSGKAQEAFKKIMELDPKFRDTKKRLASLNESIVKQETAGSTSASEVEGQSTQVKPAPSVGSLASSITEGQAPGTSQSGVDIPNTGDGNSYTGEAGTSATNVDLVLFVPGTLTGYLTGSLSKSDTYASRDYSPQGAKQQLVEFLLITVHKLDSKDEAKLFIDRVSRRAFYANAQEPILREDRKAYFGTDETTYANLSWYDGNLVYEVQMQSATNSPSDLYNEIIEVGRQIP